MLKAVLPVFQIPAGSPMRTGFSGGFRLDRLERRTWSSTSEKVGHRNSAKGGGPLSDMAPACEGMVQKTGLGSDLLSEASLGVRVDSMAPTTTLSLLKRPLLA